MIWKSKEQKSFDAAEWAPLINRQYFIYLLSINVFRKTSFTIKKWEFFELDCSEGPEVDVLYNLSDTISLATISLHIFTVQCHFHHTCLNIAAQRYIKLNKKLLTP